MPFVSYSYKAILMHLFTFIALLLYLSTFFFNYGKMGSVPETAFQAAHQAKQLLREKSGGVGTLSTVMVSPEYQGYAYASIEYYASCPWTPWDAHPLLFISRLSWNARNFLTDRTKKVTLSVSSPFIPDGEYQKHATSILQGNTSSSPMQQPRLTLLGHLESMPLQPSNVFSEAWTCFSTIHKDAHQWENFTNKEGHDFQLYQFKVNLVYWIGGFGDEHYIGLIDIPTYEKAFSTLV